MIFIQKDIDKLTDNQIISRFKETNDLEYLGHLFVRYTDFVFLICMKYLKNEEDSKDAAMQIFENLSLLLIKHEIDNFKSWLHVVSKNYCLIKIRKEKSINEKKNVYEKDSIFFMENDINLHHTENIDKESKIKLLEKALEELNPKQKTCIKLFYLEEKTYKEIEKETGYSINEVKSSIQNGKRKLKIKLKNMNLTIISFFLLKYIFMS